jgi:hypothetical protein
MKTAIYIEDGITQLVLTPETPWEENVVNSISKGDKTAKIMNGQFYECAGGWVRQRSGFSSVKDSIIVRFDTPTSLPELPPATEPAP